METRLIIAYSLIAIMVALALIGIVAIRRHRTQIRQRDAGHGDY